MIQPCVKRQTLSSVFLSLHSYFLAPVDILSSLLSASPCSIITPNFSLPFLYLFCYLFAIPKLPQIAFQPLCNSNSSQLSFLFLLPLFFCYCLFPYSMRTLLLIVLSLHAIFSLPHLTTTDLILNHRLHSYLIIETTISYLPLS